MLISLSLLGKMITICCGTPIFIADVSGEVFNIIVFLSLQTFRQSSCGFCLTIMSLMNIGQLFTRLLSRIMGTLFGADGTESSLFYCKRRPYLLHICTVNSLACFCLATFDQYCMTCSRLCWQQCYNIKLAKRLVLANIIIWTLHGIPYLVLFELIQSPTTHQITCTSTNVIFAQYRSYVIILVLFGIPSIIIAAVFGLVAYNNVQQLANCTVPLDRRELHKQLTKMVLAQVVVNVFTLIPQSIVITLLTSPSLSSNLILQANLQFAGNTTVLIYHNYFASTFYIYIRASERFHKQLIHVLYKVHLERWTQLRAPINQVRPET